MPDRGSEKISPRREIAAATGDLIKLQREELHPGAAACCVPAIVIILVCGRIFDQPYAALVATAGAFSVGFGLFQRLSSFAIVPMLLALLGMMVSATVGTLASATPLSEGTPQRYGRSAWPRRRGSAPQCGGSCCNGRSLWSLPPLSRPI